MPPKKSQTDKTYMYHKYSNLPKVVHHLEPSAVAQIFKEQKGSNTFFPYWGIFFNEFALGYCVNLHQK